MLAISHCISIIIWFCQKRLCNAMPNIYVSIGVGSPGNKSEETSSEHDPNIAPESVWVGCYGKFLEICTVTILLPNFSSLHLSNCRTRFGGGCQSSSDQPLHGQNDLWQAAKLTTGYGIYIWLPHSSYPSFWEPPALAARAAPSSPFLSGGKCTGWCQELAIATPWHAVLLFSQSPFNWPFPAATHGDHEASDRLSLPLEQFMLQLWWSTTRGCKLCLQVEINGPICFLVNKPAF